MNKTVGVLEITLFSAKKIETELFVVHMLLYELVLIVQLLIWHMFVVHKCYTKSVTPFITYPLGDQLGFGQNPMWSTLEFSFFSWKNQNFKQLSWFKISRTLLLNIWFCKVPWNLIKEPIGYRQSKYCPICINRKKKNQASTFVISFGEGRNP